MHLGFLAEVEDEYISDSKSKCTVVPCTFETDAGFQVKVWFNDAVMSNLIEFIEAADNFKINMDNVDQLPAINLKDYIGKRVAFSVSHVKDKNNKIQAQIDNFFSADKAPSF